VKTIQSYSNGSATIKISFNCSPYKPYLFIGSMNIKSSFN